MKTLSLLVFALGAVLTSRLATHLARALAPGKADPAGCFAPIPSDYPPALREALERLRSLERFETVASFSSNVAESAALVVNAARDYGDMPLSVLTATDMGSPPPGSPPEFLAQGRALIDVFNLGHDEFAALEPIARFERLSDYRLPMRLATN